MTDFRSCSETTMTSNMTAVSTSATKAYGDRQGKLRCSWPIIKLDNSPIWEIAPSQLD